LAGGGSNVDSDVVDNNSGVSHKDDPSDWGKIGNLTWEFMHSTKAQKPLSCITNTNCYLLLSDDNY
jgi:hypothetical protein